ncbi:HET-domain-containing protein [Lophiostoma macrostomum CBS 122681]|uniref:HET-domain-containing protein n=1 Tax=Lophiostoma macrostomum CBS 122681 TaxID=1314788 RepID=A0A6A6TAI9_9PLEO|nr:HET-domain-containing protein [Lophiostoma macrostomum CBS 122681]
MPHLRERVFYAQASWSPSRLVSIKDVDADPYLVFTENKPLKATYATLSHCWGDGTPLKLTVDTLEAFREAIPFFSLSKTFQDAIIVARRLGIEYIWIDSLCIIQTPNGVSKCPRSDEDWQVEAAMMGHVYRNAFLNISATGARNGTEGLYFPRDVQKIAPIAQCPDFKVEEGGSLVLHHSPNLALINASFWDTLSIRSAAFGRAWIFQERFLSRRVLHFGKEQMFWECHTDNCCETFPEGLPIRLKEETYIILKSVYNCFQTRDFSSYHAFGSLFRLQGLTLKDKLEIFWETVVTDYTRCKLSRASDKLIALSGIAEDIYFAGIWKSHLPSGLLWIGRNHVTRPELYRAPTWSWASVDGYIEWHHSPLRNGPSCVAEVISVEAVTPGPAFGRVTEATIQLRAPTWEWERTSPAGEMGADKPVSRYLTVRRRLRDFIPPPKAETRSGKQGIVVVLECT